MKRSRIGTGLWLALMGLAGCDRHDASPLGDVAQTATGSARLAVPSLPSGYLSDSGQKAVFILTISGAGMDSIRKAWAVSFARPEPLLVEGIPAGPRHFQGRLARVDPKIGDTVITHEGGEVAKIQGGAVAEVRLFLRSLGLGAANVCVEVEGWPSDSACIAPQPPQPPEPPKFQNIFGCWSVEAADASGKGAGGTLTGSMIIVQRDSFFVAELAWSDGRIDTGLALYRVGDSVASFGAGGRGSFRFTARLDKQGLMYGPFQAPALGLDGSATARRAVCASDTLPNRRCFDIKQYGGASAVYARLGVEEGAQGDASFYIHWQGIGSRKGAGTVSGDPDSAATFEWAVAALPGVFAPDRSVDTAFYRFRLAGNELRGTAAYRGVSGPQERDVAGYPTLCVSHDFKW